MTRDDGCIWQVQRRNSPYDNLRFTTTHSCDKDRAEGSSFCPKHKAMNQKRLAAAIQRQAERRRR
jgi:hypothetical protein